VAVHVPKEVSNAAHNVWHTAQRVVHDPRITGVMRAGPRAAAFLSRSHARTAGAGSDDTVVPVHTTPGLAAQVLLDEVLIAAFRNPRLLPKGDDFANAGADIASAYDQFMTEGWLDNPSSYHHAPPAPDEVLRESNSVLGMRYEHVAYPSGWEPHENEAGRERWLAHEANHTSHAWIARSPQPSNSWLVCVHGFGLGGNALMDMRSFRAKQLTQSGVNVAIVVLPLHGARSEGKAMGEGFMSIDLIDSLHGLAQAAWDVRRMIAWLRHAEGAERVGIFGHSLGGSIASLVAGLEDDLACVIAGVPVVDLPDLYRRHSLPDIARQAESLGVLGPAGDAVHRVVSPLSMACRVPYEGRFIFAGLGDRMATFAHAHRLWLHWDRPQMASYGGGHIGFFWSGAVKEFVTGALEQTGLASIPPVSQEVLAPL
jgi:pimeloyl-ACP methyl ester carboxylesterase